MKKILVLALLTASFSCMAFSPSVTEVEKKTKTELTFVAEKALDVSLEITSNDVLSIQPSFESSLEVLKAFPNVAIETAVGFSASNEMLKSYSNFSKHLIFYDTFKIMNKTKHNLFLSNTYTKLEKPDILLFAGESTSEPNFLKSSFSLFSHNKFDFSKMRLTNFNLN